MRKWAVLASATFTLLVETAFCLSPRGVGAPFFGLASLEGSSP